MGGATTSGENEVALAAALEKAYQAERNTAWLRLVLIVFVSAVFYPFLDKGDSVLWLAYGVTAAATTYAVLNVWLQPYRRVPALRSAAFTSATDAVLITLWILATGGFESPFYVIWYVSLIAIAFRYGARATLVVTGAYALTYMALLAATGELVGNVPIVAVRVGHIGLIGILGALLSRETLAQTLDKLRMRNLAIEARSVGERLQRREADLRSNVSVLDAILEAAADGLLVVDRQGRIVRFNRRFLDMWRIPPALAERGDEGTLLAYVEDQLLDPKAFRDQVRQVYEAPTTESRDEVHFRDGRVFERYSMAHVVDGRYAGRVWSFSDVTEARRHERERLDALQRAEELERLKEQDRFKTRFINQVAHELWTPLTPIKIQLFLLQRRASLGAQDLHALQVIGRNLDRLQQLVQEMLDGARLEAGRFQVTRVRMDLAATVHEAVDMFAPAARQKGVWIAARIDPALWVMGDPDRLTQALHNLLSNAVKFTPRGGRIEIAATRRAKDVLVRVEDTGPGLAPDQADRLFQPFSQVHDTMEYTRSGTGLGLYITKGIVEAHEGGIEVRSPGPGQGSVFEVRLPALPHPAYGDLSSGSTETGSAEGAL